jgi:multidrug efflux pump subunit AcrA (membrane-fusion protein)
MTKKLLTGLLVLTTVVLLAGCGGPAVTHTVSANISPAKSKADGTVVAEAVIEPARWSELHFDTGGKVALVLVSPGDQVAAGAPLLRLATGKLEISLQSARQDVVAQQASLDQLLKGTSEKVIARADRQNAQQIDQAEIALQVKQLQLDRTRTEDPAADVAAAGAGVEQLKLQLAQMEKEPVQAGVALAQSAVDSARAQLDQLLAGPDERTVEIARLNWELAKNHLWQAQLERDALGGQSGVPGYQKELGKAAVGAAEISASIAQLEHALAGKGATDEATRIAEAGVRQAQAQRDQALGAQEVHAIGLEILRAQIDEAEAQLSQAIAAQEAYTITLEMLAAEVEAARLEIEALRAWENPYRDKASDEEIAQAKTRLQQAELAVDQLELQLQDAELRAPFAGTVVEVWAKAGDQVIPDETAIVLATLDQLQVRTTDLSELDVAHVAVGQPVTVTMDGLPGREFAGVVRKIALQAREHHGDVVYDATIELTEPEPTEALRWGMTAAVKIQTD